MPLRKGLVDRNVCIGGKIENEKCQCPSNTALIGYECKSCIGGSILAGRCKCPQGKILIRNNCTVAKTCPSGYYRDDNNECVFKGFRFRFPKRIPGQHFLQ